MRISDWSSDVCSSDRHPRLHAPGHHRLVGAQAVELVQRIELAHRLLVEGARVRRLVEVQVAAEGLVAALARSEERRVGKEWSVRVDLGVRRIIKKKQYLPQAPRNRVQRKQHHT